MKSLGAAGSIAEVVGHSGVAFPQGLKPALIFARFMYGLKPVPFKLAHYHYGERI